MFMRLHLQINQHDLMTGLTSCGRDEFEPQRLESEINLGVQQRTGMDESRFIQHLRRGC